MTEQNGGGVGLFDYDADGICDVFLVNGSHSVRPADAAKASNRLYRGAGALRYSEVTRAAGVESYGFGMGCAAGDFDNDGFTDLLIAGYAGNRLFRNSGDGTLAETVLPEPQGDNIWGTSAAFADLDNDGDLDLYLVNYVNWSPSDPPCYTQHETPVRISCGPIGRTGQPDALYENLGDGTFRDVSAEAGINTALGKGLGVSVADFDGDGLLDIFVANDTTENQLWRNLGQLEFQDVALPLGVAVGADGVAHSGMGIGCADGDGDGRFDLVVTNFQGEPNDFFQNLGSAGFVPRNAELGLDPISRPVLGFGAVMADFDLDGFPELFVANGHVWDLTPLNLGYSYAMPAHLLWNREGRRFQNVSVAAGSYFQEEVVGRAAAVGDLDGDGDLDLAVTHLSRRAALLRNDTAVGEGRGVRLRLVGVRAARQPLGITVAARVGGREWTLRIPSGDSFQSSSAPEILIPVKATESIEQIRVEWGPGQQEIWREIPAAVQSLTLRQGTGRQE